MYSCVDKDCSTALETSDFTIKRQVIPFYLLKLPQGSGQSKPGKEQNEKEEIYLHIL